METIVYYFSPAGLHSLCDRNDCAEGSTCQIAAGGASYQCVCGPYTTGAKCDGTVIVIYIL